AVGEKRAAEAALLAFLDEAGALGDADQRARGVEDLDQHEDEDDMQQAAMQRADDVELQEGRQDRRRGRDDAAELADAEDPGEDRHDEDADEDGAANAQRIEHGNDEEAEDRQKRAGLLEVAEADEGRRVVDDDAGALQGDDAEEE